VGVTADQQILREIMIREIETIHRYQDMLERAGHADLQRFLAHAIYEEKEHVAEALQILRAIDPMQDAALSEDHGAHFRAGGAGDRALKAILANASIDKAERTSEDTRTPGPAPTTASPLGQTAPGADLNLPTVGSLRPRP
jgi:hypothetical protein